MKQSNNNNSSNNLQVPACPKCNSLAISFDTMGQWNMDKQTLELTLEQVYCDNCHESGDYVLIPASN